MPVQRSSDPNGKLYFRSDRITAINGEYFFATREGTLEGPFNNRYEACIQVNLYIHYHKMAHAVANHR